MAAIFSKRSAKKNKKITIALLIAFLILTQSNRYESQLSNEFKKQFAVKTFGLKLSATLNLMELEGKQRCVIITWMLMKILFQKMKYCRK